jgi:AcrR family transcriptional regulator
LPKKTTRQHVTSDELLEAGWEIIRDQLRPGDASRRAGAVPMSRLLGSVSARDVVDRRGVSTGAFYRRWNSRRGYLQALVAYILDKDRRWNEYLGRALDQLGESLARQRSIPEVIRDVTEIDLDATTNSDAFAVQMHFWSLCRSNPELKPLLAT